MLRRGGTLTPWVYCVAHAINRSMITAFGSEPIKNVLEKAQAVYKLFEYSTVKRSAGQKVFGLATKNLKFFCRRPLCL